MNVSIGIDVWSKFSPAGQAGIQDFLIENNIVVLNHEKRAGLTSCSGVNMNAGSDRPIDGLLIRNNTIRLTALGQSSARSDQYSQAFCFVRADSTGIIDRNIVMEGNLVDGAAAGGVRIVLPGGEIDGFRLVDNVFRNVGQLGTSSYDGSRNSGLLAELATAKHWLIAGNQFVDAQSTHTLNRGFYMVIKSLTDVAVRDNRIWAVDGAPIQHMSSNAVLGQVVLHASVQKWLRPTGRIARGSRVFDESMGQMRTQLDNPGANWSVETPGTFVAANSDSAVALGKVTRKIQVFDAAGISLGFVPVYSTIT